MNEKEIMIVVGAIVGIFLIIKFWRFFLKISVIGIFIIGGLYFYQEYRKRPPSITPRDPIPSRPSVPVRNSLPDLIIVDVHWEPRGSVFKSGTKIRFFLRIRNIGNAPVQSFVRVAGPGNYSGGVAGGIKIGETKIATVEYPVYGSGVTHNLSFTVDRENTIQESNESNNISRQIMIKTSF